MKKLINAMAILAIPCIMTAQDAPSISSTSTTYTIPDSLTPVSKWSNGFTLKEADRLREAYNAADYISGNDITAFAWLNLSEVVPTMMITRGANQVANLKRELLPKIADVVATTKLGTMTLANALLDPRSRMQAIMVLHKGKIVYETYPGMPDNMYHVWNSSSKTITGLLIHQLVNEGLVDLKAPVSKYLEFTKGSPIGDIKVEDVLHHRSGLDYEESQANFQNPNHPLGRVLSSGMTARGVPVGPGVKDVVAEVKAHRSPNTAFEYSTFNTQILGFIAEEVMNKPWNRLVSERIWSQSGMEGDGLLAISSAGEGLHGGAYASTLRDFGRFGLLFTPSWEIVANKRVVPENYLSKVYTAANPDIYRKGYMGPRLVEVFGKDDAPKGASYQWDAVFADGDLYKGGLGGQAIYVSPETDTVVVYFSSTWQNSLLMIAYSRAIVKTYFRKN